MDIKPLPDVPPPWHKISASLQKASWNIGEREITATVALDSPRGQCVWDLVGLPFPPPVAIAGEARTFKEARAAAELAIRKYAEQSTA